MKSIEDDVATVGAIAAVPTILDVACRTTGMGFAAVARVTEGRWTACALLDNIHFGLKPGGDLKVETTICHEIRQSEQAVVIDDVEQDVLYCNHPTPAMYGFRSYISVPIILADGTFFGTLCAIDPLPRALKGSGAPGMFKLFADMIAHHLDAEMRVEDVQLQLAKERDVARLREEFMAILGHDLRSPLAAVSSGIRLLAPEVRSERGGRFLELMQSSIIRMGGLIDNVLDFARSRLGDGIILDLENRPLEATLQHVVDELRIGNGDRPILQRYHLEGPVLVDHQRIAQMVSNLIGNALRYGSPEHPIEVAASVSDGLLSISVANSGTPIAPEVLPRLFQPFVRGEDKSIREGLGLGLHIASQIALAHGGDIKLTSTTEQTRFTFRVPLRS